MRARNLKPGFWKHEGIAECPFAARLLFQGLWCLADRRGVLEDRPRRIKAEVFPYDDITAAEISKWIDELERVGVVYRYEADGYKCLAITAFAKHANPHHKEPASDLPDPPNSPDQGEPRKNQACREKTRRVRERTKNTVKVESSSTAKCASSPLNPESLNPETMNREAGILKPEPPQPPRGGLGPPAEPDLPWGLTVEMARLWAEVYGEQPAWAMREEGQIRTLLDQGHSPGEVLQRWRRFLAERGGYWRGHKLAKFVGDFARWSDAGMALQQPDDDQAILADWRGEA